MVAGAWGIGTGLGELCASTAGRTRPPRRADVKVARRFTLEGGFHEGLALLRVLPPGLVGKLYPLEAPLNIDIPEGALLIASADPPRPELQPQAPRGL